MSKPDIQIRTPEDKLVSLADCPPGTNFRVIGFLENGRPLGYPMPDNLPGRGEELELIKANRGRNPERDVTFRRTGEGIPEEKRKYTTAAAEMPGNLLYLNQPKKS